MTPSEASTAQATAPLHGKEVCLTGRLWTMDHRTARRRLREQGAHCTTLPGIGTDLVIVGEAGPPLGPDGSPTRALLLAEQHRRAGHHLRLVRETEFLTLLGLQQSREDLERLYTVEQLARILSIPTATVRRWVRLGLIHPAKETARLALFSFPQVSAARDLCRLAEAGLSPRKLKRSLERIQAWLPDGDVALGQLEILSHNSVGVRLADGSVAEPSGQLRLQFDGPQDGPAIPHLSPEAHRPVAEANAPTTGPGGLRRDWFADGVAAEECGDLSAAIHAYRQSLLSGGPQPETSFNLGNCYYATERLEDAIEMYTRAVNIEPDYCEAWNNLGNTLSDLERVEEALDAYRRALTASPDYADAHYNLAETLAWLGDVANARAHWRAYLQQDPSSAWARRVRQRLAEFEG